MILKLEYRYLALVICIHCITDLMKQKKMSKRYERQGIEIMQCYEIQLGNNIELC